MTHGTKRTGLWGVLLLGAASIAYADVPPPPGYVEQCSIVKQKKDGEDCQTSRPYYGDRNRGQREWGTKGYTRRCRTNGASVWMEIWCKTADAPPPAAKPPSEPTTQPSTDAPASPAPVIVLDAGLPAPIAPPDAGTAPQPVPSPAEDKKAPEKASEPGAAKASPGVALVRKSQACSASGEATASWLAGLAILALVARRRRCGAPSVDPRGGRS